METVPVHSNQAAPARAKKHKRITPKTIITSIVAIIIIGSLVVLGLFLFKASAGANIDSSKYQAVFLTSGQVYFGKLDNAGSSFASLTDVFYIQASSSEESENPQNASTDVTDLQLIKLGSEVHGPEDEMLISRDQILFIENLKADGKVSSSIKEYYDKLND